MYKIYLRTFDQKVTDKTNTASQATALDAFAEIVGRTELDGQTIAAVLSYQARQLAYHRFDREPGDMDYWRDRLHEIELPISPVGAPRQLRDGRSVNVYLDSESLARAAALSKKGSISEGIRLALAAAKPTLL